MHWLQTLTELSSQVENRLFHTADTFNEYFDFILLLSNSLRYLDLDIGMLIPYSRELLA
jgi:hypothetical protein